jgi:hypothetical protein
MERDMAGGSSSATPNAVQNALRAKLALAVGRHDVAKALMDRMTAEMNQLMAAEPNPRERAKVKNVMRDGIRLVRVEVDGLMEEVAEALSEVEAAGLDGAERRLGQVLPSMDAQLGVLYDTAEDAVQRQHAAFTGVLETMGQKAVKKATLIAKMEALWEAELQCRAAIRALQAFVWGPTGGEQRSEGDAAGGAPDADLRAARADPRLRAAVGSAREASARVDALFAGMEKELGPIRRSG